MNSYVSLLVNLGRYSTAADWAERLMEANIRVHKFKHPNTQRAIINAVRLRTNEGKNDAALRIIDPALAQARREFGGDDPKSLNLLTMPHRAALQTGRPRRGRVEPQGSAGIPNA